VSLHERLQIADDLFEALPAHRVAGLGVCLQGGIGGVTGALTKTSRPPATTGVRTSEARGDGLVDTARSFMDDSKRLRGLPRPNEPQPRASTSRQKASTRAFHSSGTSWKGWWASSITSNRATGISSATARHSGGRVATAGEDERRCGDLRQAVGRGPRRRRGSAGGPRSTACGGRRAPPR
jgi:hypothetical protein